MDIKNCDIVLSFPALTAFKKTKNILSKSKRLSYVVPGNQLCLAEDASSIGVGAFLQKRVDDHWKLVFSFSKSWHQLKVDTAHLDERFWQYIRWFANFDIYWRDEPFTSWPTKSLCGVPSSQVLTGTHHVKRDIWNICCNSLQVSVLWKRRTPFLVVLMLSCLTRMWNTNILGKNRQSCSIFFKTTPHLLNYRGYRFQTEI